MNRAQDIASAAWLLWAILFGGSAPLAAAEVDGVDSGRRALHESGQNPYPWYDGDKDAIRRIHVQPESTSSKTPSSSSGYSSSGGGADFSGTNTIVFVVAAVVLGLLVFVLVRSYLRKEDFPAQPAVARPSVAAFDPARVEALPFDINSGTGDLLGEVRRRRDLGDYAAAVVYLFSYQLLELDRHHWIRLTKGKTNRQYLREMAGRQRELRSLVEPTMVACEEVFFGHHPLAKERFEACWSHLTEFGRLVGAGAT